MSAQVMSAQSSYASGAFARSSASETCVNNGHNLAKEAVISVPMISVPNCLAAYPHVALEPNDKGCKYWMTPARNPKHSFFVNHFRESWISHGSAGLDRLVPKPGCWEKAFRQISCTNSNLYRKWIWCSLMHQFAQDCAGTYKVCS